MENDGSKTQRMLHETEQAAQHALTEHGRAEKEVFASSRDLEHIETKIKGLQETMMKQLQQQQQSQSNSRSIATDTTTTATSTKRDRDAQLPHDHKARAAASRRRGRRAERRGSALPSSHLHHTRTSMQRQEKARKRKLILERAVQELEPVWSKHVAHIDTAAVEDSSTGGSCKDGNLAATAPLPSVAPRRKTRADKRLNKAIAAVLPNISMHTTVRMPFVPMKDHVFRSEDREALKEQRVKWVRKQRRQEQAELEKARQDALFKARARRKADCRAELAHREEREERRRLRNEVLRKSRDYDRLQRELYARRRDQFYAQRREEWLANRKLIALRSQDEAKRRRAFDAARRRKAYRAKWKEREKRLREIDERFLARAAASPYVVLETDERYQQQMQREELLLGAFRRGGQGSRRRGGGGVRQPEIEAAATCNADAASKDSEAGCSNGDGEVDAREQGVFKLTQVEGQVPSSTAAATSPAEGQPLANGGGGSRNENDAGDDASGAGAALTQEMPINTASLADDQPTVVAGSKEQVVKECTTEVNVNVCGASSPAAVEQAIAPVTVASSDRGHDKHAEQRVRLQEKRKASATLKKGISGDDMIKLRDAEIKRVMDGTADPPAGASSSRAGMEKSDGAGADHAAQSAPAVKKSVPVMEERTPEENDATMSLEKAVDGNNEVVDDTNAAVLPSESEETNASKRPLWLDLSASPKRVVSDKKPSWLNNDGARQSAVKESKPSWLTGEEPKKPETPLWLKESSDMSKKQGSATTPSWLSSENTEPKQSGSSKDVPSWLRD